jgi:hypothetical protein
MTAVRLIQMNRQVDAIKQNVPRNDVFGEAWHGYQLDIFLPHFLTCSAAAACWRHAVDCCGPSFEVYLGFNQLL